MTMTSTPTSPIDHIPCILDNNNNNNNSIGCSHQPISPSKEKKNLVAHNRRPHHHHYQQTKKKRPLTSPIRTPVRKLFGQNDCSTPTTTPTTPSSSSDYYDSRSPYTPIVSFSPQDLIHHHHQCADDHHNQLNSNHNSNNNHSECQQSNEDCTARNLELVLDQMTIYNHRNRISVSELCRRWCSIAPDHKILLVFLRFFECTFCQATIAKIAANFSMLLQMNTIPVLVHQEDESYGTEYFSNNDASGSGGASALKNYQPIVQHLYRVSNNTVSQEANLNTYHFFGLGRQSLWDAPIQIQKRQKHLMKQGFQPYRPWMSQKLSYAFRMPGMLVLEMDHHTFDHTQSHVRVCNQFKYTTVADNPNLMRLITVTPLAQEPTLAPNSSDSNSNCSEDSSDDELSEVVLDYDSNDEDYDVSCYGLSSMSGDRTFSTTKKETEFLVGENSHDCHSSTIEIEDKDFMFRSTSQLLLLSELALNGMNGDEIRRLTLVDPYSDLSETVKEKNNKKAMRRKRLNRFFFICGAEGCSTPLENTNSSSSGGSFLSRISKRLSKTSLLEQSRGSISPRSPRSPVSPCDKNQTSGMASPSLDARELELSFNITVKHIISNEETKKYFKIFCAEEASIENVFFLEAVDIYNHAVEMQQDNIASNLAIQIMETFLDEHSSGSNELNITQSIINQIRTKFEESGPVADLFKDAETEVLVNQLRDTLTRFKNRPEFVTVVQLLTRDGLDFL